MRLARIYKQRTAGMALLIALIVPILAACGGGGGGAPAATQAPGGAATQAPADTATEAPAAETAAPADAATEAPAAETAAVTSESGGTLRILYWQAPVILNPHLATGTKDFDAATIIMEPLARWNENSELIPFLAEEIPTQENGGIADDNLSVTWKLKEGVTWSDGSDFTADDVVFTWQYCADEATACTTNAAFTPVENVEAVDSTTVKVTWKEPNGNPYQTFVGQNGMVLQKAQFENCIGAAAATDAACQAANNAPIGTNAYKLKEFKSGDTVIYERNPEYRDAENVFFDEINLKGGGDAVSAARAVCETGDVDFAWNLQVPAQVLNPILEAGKCDPVSTGTFGIERIVVNFADPDPTLGEDRSEPSTQHPILSDLKVRQAINLAINRQAIVEQIYGIGGKPTCNIVTAPEDITSKNTSCDRDIEQAKTLLEEAGWTVGSDGIREKDGKKLKLLFQTSTNQVRQATQAIVKQSLQEVGIDVELKNVDAGVFFGGDPGNPDTLNKFYADLQMYTNSPTDPDPVNYFDGFTCAKVNSKENQWNGGNDGRYCNEEFDTLFAELSTAFDPAERKEKFIRLNDIMVNDVALIPLVDRTTPQGKAKNLTGPSSPTFDSQFWNIAEWRLTN
jgi:peptide/nickel transport system substrate-binding protein